MNFTIPFMVNRTNKNQSERAPKQIARDEKIEFGKNIKNVLSERFAMNLLYDVFYAPQNGNVFSYLSNASFSEKLPHISIVISSYGNVQWMNKSGCYEIVTKKLTLRDRETIFNMVKNEYTRRKNAGKVREN